MRPCNPVVLGASSHDLPKPVTEEVRRFFQMCLDKLVPGGLTPNSASEFLATIIGALVVATAFGTPLNRPATKGVLKDRAKAAA